VKAVRCTYASLFEKQKTCCFNMKNHRVQIETKIEGQNQEIEILYSEGQRLKHWYLKKMPFQ